jgi:hypothetical protein
MKPNPLSPTIRLILPFIVLISVLSIALQPCRRAKLRD